MEKFYNAVDFEGIGILGKFVYNTQDIKDFREDIRTLEKVAALRRVKFIIITDMATGAETRIPIQAWN